MLGGSAAPKLILIALQYPLDRVDAGDDGRVMGRHLIVPIHIQMRQEPVEEFLVRGEIPLNQCEQRPLHQSNALFRSDHVSVDLEVRDEKVERGANHQKVLALVQARKNGVDDEVGPIRVVKVLEGLAKLLTILLLLVLKISLFEKILMFWLQVGPADNLLLPDFFEGPLGQLLSIFHRLRLVSVVAALDDHLALGDDQVVLGEVDLVLFVRLIRHSLAFVKFDGFVHIFGYFLVEVLDGGET